MLSPTPEGPTIHAHPDAGDWSGLGSQAREGRDSGELRAADSFTVFTSGQNLVVSVACCETGILFSSGVRI